MSGGWHYGAEGPSCAPCMAEYPEGAWHESCAEVTISRESVPMIVLAPREDTP